MNAIDMLKQDHRMVEQLMQQFHQSTSHEERGELRNQIVRMLSVHAAAEEEVLYPTIKEALPEGEQLVGESLNEHQMVKELLTDIDRMSPDDEGFDEKVRMLEQNVMHHVQEEEGEILPKFGSAVGDEILVDLGRELEEAKGRAPTRPHPMAPNQPPGLTLAAPMAALMDRIRDRVQRRSA